jgi:hypothetical protein
MPPFLAKAESNGRPPQLLLQLPRRRVGFVIPLRQQLLSYLP